MSASPTAFIAGRRYVSTADCAAWLMWQPSCVPVAPQPPVGSLKASTVRKVMFQFALAYAATVAM